MEAQTTEAVDKLVDAWQRARDDEDVDGPLSENWLHAMHHAFLGMNRMRSVWPLQTQYHLTDEDADRAHAALASFDSAFELLSHLASGILGDDFASALGEISYAEEMERFLTADLL